MKTEIEKQENIQRRYFMHLGYNGANYFGWQSQPNGNTVQQTIENALSILLHQPTAILGAGRTDSGVHARSMYAHFDSDGEIDKVQLAYRLNNFLPKDIVIYNIREVRGNAHARFDALSRTYRYYITTAKDPYCHDLKWRVFQPLDIDKMNEAASLLLRYIDFTSFSKLHTDVKTNNCVVKESVWAKEGNDYIFKITANRFLRNMVRAIVGTLVDVGKGKITADDFSKIIEAKDRGLAGFSAPGYALFLENVEYPQDIYIDKTE